MWQLVGHRLEIPRGLHGKLTRGTIVRPSQKAYRKNIGLKPGSVFIEWDGDGTSAGESADAGGGVGGGVADSVDACNPVDLCSGRPLSQPDCWRWLEPLPGRAPEIGALNQMQADAYRELFSELKYRLKRTKGPCKVKSAGAGGAGGVSGGDGEGAAAAMIRAEEKDGAATGAPGKSRKVRGIVAIMATLHAKIGMPPPVARKRGHEDGAEAGGTNEGAAKIPEGFRRVAPLPARPPRGTTRFNEGEVENMLIYIFKGVPLSCYEANPMCMYSQTFWRGAIEAKFIAEGRTAKCVAQFAKRVLKGYVEKHYDDSKGKKPETALRTRKRKTSTGPAPTQAPHSKPGKRTRRAKSTQPSRFERNVSGQEVLAPAEAVDSHAQAQLEALQQELREATLAKSEAERRLRAERAQSDRRAIRDARTLASLDAEQRRTKAELAKVRAALLLHAPNCPEALSDGTCARTMRWPYVPGARAARARGEEPASGQGGEQLRQGSLASLEDVLRLLRAEAEPSNEAIANTLDYIGDVQEKQGALDSALASYEEVLRLRRAAAKKPSDGAIAVALENIGFVQGMLGAPLETARKKHQEALDIRLKALGDDHPDVAVSLLNISDCHNKMGRHDEALAEAEESARICRAALESGSDDRDVHHNLGIATNNTGEALHGLGRFDEAIAKYEEALDVYAVVGLRDDHAHPTEARDLLGRAKRGEGPECCEGRDSGQDEEQATDGATPCAVEPVEQVRAQ